MQVTAEMAREGIEGRRTAKVAVTLPMRLGVFQYIPACTFVVELTIDDPGYRHANDQRRSKYENREYGLCRPVCKSCKRDCYNRWTALPTCPVMSIMLCRLAFGSEVAVSDHAFWQI